MDAVMRTSDWVSTASRLPIDGQPVLAKASHGGTERRVTFYAKPAPRWEDPYFSRQLEFFDSWRPLS